ncbi:MAG: ATP-binding protein, partial [Leptospiraceae bacterium]|nr:ATP-binding protein [Leptospiraceae bacterium]
MFISTPAIEKILSELRKGVERNEWIAVLGEIGTGKTEIKNFLISEWERRRDKYVVIQFPTFRSEKSRINKIMKWMLEKLTPDDHIPVDVELKAEKLRTALMRAHNNHRKVILVLEDVGSINEFTFRELKKVHELTGLGQKHLFSILMFGNESRVTKSVLRGEEIGFRCRTLYTQELNENEMIYFAEKRFGLSFPKGREGQLVKGYFTRNVRKTPLGVCAVAERLKTLKEFKGEVNMNLLIKARVLEAKMLKDKIQKLGITSTEIQSELMKQGTRVSESTIRMVLNDKGNYKEETVA